MSCEAPAIVTLRVVRGIPSLRCTRFIEDLRASFLRSVVRPDFRLVHYSIQDDHLHLIVEADGHEAMGRGMRSLSTRVACAVRRVFRLPGRVMAGRYHLRWLATPREVRNALQYVLLNERKHDYQRSGHTVPASLDEASSGRWFSGWSTGTRGHRTGRPEISYARTWLLRTGWRRHGLIDPRAVPGRA